VSIPQELLWVQSLINRTGVAGTLTLIATNCRDRGVMTADDSAEQRVAARLWQRRAEIVEAAADQVRQIEPERFTDKGPSGEKPI
jgi:hypothetical protein